MPTYALLPNRYYYGRRPRIGIQLPLVSDAYKSYLAGKLDAEVRIPDPFVSRWRGGKDYRAFPSPNISFLTPDVNLAPFNNVHCRLAVAYAIDRNTLANNIEHGLGRVTYAVVPKGMLGFYAGRDNPHYSPTSARAQLARCPGRAIPFGLTFINYAPQAADQANAIVAMLRAVGLNATTKSITPDQFGSILGHMDETNTQLFQNAWAQDYPDPSDYCVPLLHSRQIGNLGNWVNRKYDELVDRAEVTLNRKARARLYLAAQHMALSQGAMIPLTNDRNELLVKPYAYGLVGSEAHNDLVPLNDDWANVSVAKH